MGGEYGLEPVFYAFKFPISKNGPDVGISW
jgi:hypothetical protein